VGAVSTKGGEFEIAWDTPLTGLSLTTAGAYNKGKYTSFPNAPCYNGQTLAQGCMAGTSGEQFQDLSGTELVRAPKWMLQGGFNYETGLGNALKLGLSSNVNYSSSYLTQSASAPASRMPRYALVDATLRISNADNGWEAALIGRNLTNKYYYTFSNDLPFAPGEFYGPISRGREIMVRIGYKI
jgi:iron complex outermembrane receptor protein